MTCGRLVASFAPVESVTWGGGRGTSWLLWLSRTKQSPPDKFCVRSRNLCDTIWGVINIWILYCIVCQYFLTKTGTQGSAKSRVKITAHLNSLPLLLRSLLEKFCVRSQNLCEKNNLRKTINLLQYFCERKQFLEGMIWCFCVYSCFPWETCVHSQNFCDRNNLGRRKNSNSVGYIYNRTKGVFGGRGGGIKGLLSRERNIKSKI